MTLSTMVFQFHKGTIKTDVGGHIPHNVRNFNSIKVQLKQLIYFLIQFVNLNFNSIKVQLKLLHRLEVAVVTQFQFHKGTIKTNVPSALTIIVSLFQFHKGTIKTATKTQR